MCSFLPFSCPSLSSSSSLLSLARQKGNGPLLFPSPSTFTTIVEKATRRRKKKFLQLKEKGEKRRRRERLKNLLLPSLPLRAEMKKKRSKLAKMACIGFSHPFKPPSKTVFMPARRWEASTAATATVGSGRRRGEGELQSGRQHQHSGEATGKEEGGD